LPLFTHRSLRRLAGLPPGPKSRQACAMTTTPQDPPNRSDSPAARGGRERAAEVLSASARDHLWMHFTRMSAYETAPVPVIVRGEGPYI